MKMQYEGVARGFKWLGIRPTAGIVMVIVMKMDIIKAGISILAVYYRLSKEGPRPRRQSFLSFLSS